MDTFLISDLTRLMQSNHGPCVTIMMPTHVGGPDQQQDALRLGNLADLAQESLSNGWLRPGQAREWLAPVRESVSDVDFWGNRSLGLAFFLQSPTFSPMSQNIESTLVEKRIFKPAATFAKKARVPSMAAYREMHAESIKNPGKFWEREARELLLCLDPLGRLALTDPERAAMLRQLF